MAILIGEGLGRPLPVAEVSAFALGLLAPGNEVYVPPMAEIAVDPRLTKTDVLHLLGQLSTEPLTS